jgi:hypothetical protein
MKNLIIIVMSMFLMTSCGIFGPRNDYYQGMSEQKFLRQNKGAVLSNLEGNQITYRVNRKDNFYVLATFEGGSLVKLEERETIPAWMENKPVDGNRNNPEE